MTRSYQSFATLQLRHNGRDSIVCSTACSGAVQRKYQSSVSLAFVRGIHRWPVNSPRKRPVTRKMFPFDDVFMWIHRWSPRCGRSTVWFIWEITWCLADLISENKMWYVDCIRENEMSRKLIWGAHQVFWNISLSVLWTWTDECSTIVTET